MSLVTVGALASHILGLERTPCRLVYCTGCLCILGFAIIVALLGLHEMIQECLNSMLLPLPSSQNPCKPLKTLADVRQIIKQVNT